MGVTKNLVFNLLFSTSGNISQYESPSQLEGEISMVDIFGRNVNIIELFDYHSKKTNYRSRHFLIHDNILMISSSGILTPDDIIEANSQLMRILAEQDLSGLALIWDIRKLNYPGVKIRKTLLDINVELSKYVKKAYLILPRRYRLLVQVFNLFIRTPAIPNEVCEDVNDALKKIISPSDKKNKDKSKSNHPTLRRDELLSKSKEELVSIIENIEKKQKENVHKVVEAIGRLSAGYEFKKIDIEIDETDPNYELLNAFILMQQDMEEMIRDYKNLNKNLELKVAERIVDLIDKEANLRAILDNSDRVTWLMNTRLELIDFNIAFTNEIQRKYKKSPRIHQNVLDLIDNTRERELWKSRFEPTLKGKPCIYLDQEFYKGEERVFEIKTFPIKKSNKIKGVSVFIEDITELKKSQIKLIEKNRDLEKLNRELDSFVYRVSHDLRAPLTSILGLINLMKLEKDRDKLQEYITLQEKSITKLDQFIRDIINLSRNSRFGVTVSKIDFGKLVNDIFEDQIYAPFAKKVKPILEIEEGLSFYSDKQRLNVILSNLISNSFKYANPYRDDPYVKVKIRTEGGEGIIEVSDNGIGISDLHIPKIFGMFFRATHKLSGTGLGLYIVKETVEKLEGTVSVKSEKQEGSTFTVTIPNMKERYEQAPRS